MNRRTLLERKIRAKRWKLFALCIAFVTLTHIVYQSVQFNVVQEAKNEPNERRYQNQNEELNKDSEIYQNRVRALSHVCSTTSSNHHYKYFFDKANTMAYCPIEKVGCTYWKNIFRYINNETGGNVYESPFDIPRMLTHSLAFDSIRVVYFDEPWPEHLDTSLRFLFVREPYSRLWSAWIDKFWLPGEWPNTGRHIAHFLNRSDESQKCYGNATFQQFLLYVTNDKFKENPDLINNHWKPYSHLCDPCRFKPQIIGKMESFSTDTRTILKELNLTWILDLPRKSFLNEKEINTALDTSVQEINLLTKSNFDWGVILKKYDKNCFDDVDVYYRLWKAFQYNGHLPLTASFPFTEHDRHSLTPEIFIQKCEETYSVWKKEPGYAPADQKKKMMIQAYKAVPMEVLHKLQSLYALDFQMFQYDKEPSYLFGDRLK